MANTGKILAALLIGAVAGTALGVLFAPDKGSETRKKMAGKASELGDELKEQFNKSKQAVNDIKERVRNKVEEVKNSAQSHAN